MEFTARGVCCHPAAPQGFLENGLRWLLAQHSRDLSSSLVQMPLLKMRSNYMTLLIFHYLLWVFYLFIYLFSFFHFPAKTRREKKNEFFPAADGSSQAQRPPPIPPSPFPPLPPWETDVACVSRDNSNNSDGSLSVSLSAKCCLTNKSAKPAVPEATRGHKNIDRPGLLREEGAELRGGQSW